ncbi:MAG: hypothetical protein FWF29_05165, partial [Treponema sp.]|nr:hypothetical protein [Treponema sp.]
MSKNRLTGNNGIFNIIAYVFIAAIACICLLPFLLVITGSITDENSIYADGFTLFPKHISFFAYGVILKSP